MMATKAQLAKLQKELAKTEANLAKAKTSLQPKPVSPADFRRAEEKSMADLELLRNLESAKTVVQENSTKSKDSKSKTL